MAFKEIFIPAQGWFVKSDSFEEVNNTLVKEQLKLGRSLLVPGEKTDLDGFFNIQPALFCGHTINHNATLTTSSEAMYFYLGADEENIFNPHFFEVIHRITDSRIFCLLSDRGGRDYNFINGHWDWERKRNSKKDFGKRIQEKTFKCPICGGDLEYFEYAENSVYAEFKCYDCDEDFTKDDLNKN